MTKKTRTLSLSPENDEFLAEKDNASAFVNRLLTEYRGNESVDQTIRRYRLRRERRELERLRDSVEIQTELVEELDESVPDADELREQRIEEFAHKLHMEETLSGGLKPRISEEEIKSLAADAGCDPVELIEKAKELYHD